MSFASQIQAKAEMYSKEVLQGAVPQDPSPLAAGVFIVESATSQYAATQDPEAQGADSEAAGVEASLDREV